MTAPPTPPGAEWWRHAVIYQIYPRSFADSDGDGVGDLPGIVARLGAVADLGADAVWLSPFYRSPMNDAGYDVADYRDVDPLFGTLADAEALVGEAHRLGLRVIVDLVPNHTSSEHAWFRAALAAGPGSPERARYVFRDGHGADGGEPPNNWRSAFGGAAWTRVTEADGRPGQWYLHLFDTTQPDLDWSNREVHDEILSVMRFWLDRGVDGFRVDVAHSLVKAEDLPHWHYPEDDPGTSPSEEDPDETRPPMWDQEGVHDIYREWRTLLDSYDGERMAVAEAWVSPYSRLARYARPDELHQAFNFVHLEAPWRAPDQRRVIDLSLAGSGEHGAPVTWVLSNHDVVRHATRLGYPPEDPVGTSRAGIGPRDPQPDAELGLRRARAATLTMLGLPGSAYLYRGEELGLPEATTLPDAVRQDPGFHRSDGSWTGRDGCRVPIPWQGDAPSYGFGPGAASWLPQPPSWAELSRAAQEGVAGSTLEMYRRALGLRRELGLGVGGRADLVWLDGHDPATTVAYRREVPGGAVAVLANLGPDVVELPDGAELLVSSAPLTVTDAGPALGTDVAAWVRLPAG
ncbi:MAG: glycoside hydrolase family 13 protein [Kineosporiaceae bacterium]